MGKNNLVIGFTMVYRLPYEMIVHGKSPWKCPNMSVSELQRMPMTWIPFCVGGSWVERFEIRAWISKDPLVFRVCLTLESGGCPEMMDERGWRNSWNHISAILPDFTGLTVLRIGWTNFFLWTFWWIVSRIFDMEPHALKLFPVWLFGHHVLGLILGRSFSTSAN